ncbi:MAG: lytic murein transglycosylase [Pseudomonadota bacterium]|nr:lytic murein transglycosylase [Pseudomonadota bacterium]
MKIFLKSICCIVFALGLQTSNAFADSGFDTWKKDFYAEALKAGINRKVLDKALPNMHLLERVIRLDTQKPEYASNFYDYTNRRLTPERIETGRQMARRYKTWLARVEEKYGVPHEYLLALWGMETNFGSFMGSVDMLDSLSTLAYHPRRRKFFTGELIGYLKIVQNERGVAPKTGSWDGGFGHFQFMPTTFLAYAVDGDENGRRDIVNNMPDAFSSAANYLHQMGWNRDEPWGREVIVPDDFDWHQIHKHEKKTVADWEQLGIAPRHIKSFPDREKNTIAEWHVPMGKNGPVFLTYPNFKIIMRWNKLSLYAISVGMLADVIKKRYDPIKPPPEFRPFKTRDIMCLQNKLTEMGYSTQGADGQIGPKTRQAVAAYQRAHGLTPDAYPSFELLQQMECQNAEQ